MEAQLTGQDAPSAEPQCRLLSEAIRVFAKNKEAQGLSLQVLSNHKRELKRLLDFSEAREVFTVEQALTMDKLSAYRSTWMRLYPSSGTRALVQSRLNTFGFFCYNAGWIERAPKLTRVKIDEPETEPLADAEYAKLLEHAKSICGLLSPRRSFGPGPLASVRSH